MLSEDVYKDDKSTRPDYYDELDPCCQKEIELDSKKERIRKELRKTDRTYRRYDLTNKIFSDLRNFKNSGCYCCQNPSLMQDYPTLAKLRFRNFGSLSDVDDEANNAKEHGNDDDGSIDDEFDDLLNDSTLSSFEQDRLEAVKQHQQRLEKLDDIGLGIHKEDSIEHAEFLISNKFKTVIHIYDDQSMVDAEMDLVLEGLATSYCGTFFRRISMYEDSRVFLSKYNSNYNTMSFANSIGAGSLAIFVDGKMEKLVSVCEFYDSSSILRSDLINYLDKCKVLSEELDAMMLCSVISQGDESDAEDVGRYCEDKYCDKRYPHEHITAGKGATFAGSGTKGLGAEELLSENALYRI